MTVMASFGLLRSCYYGIFYGMSSFASSLIDALGGTSEVARHMEASVSTVHRMRTDATPSRINHLRRVAHMERPSLNVAALAAAHSIDLPAMSNALVDVSSGNAAELSGQVTA